MFALADGNNFYASCERVFNPGLEGKPVVVLSNNDGCVIARSSEAKLLGIKMAAPAFLIKDIIVKNNIAVFSSNYTLYGELSRRMMSILSEHCVKAEVYSIDECFLSFHGIPQEEILALSEEARKNVKQYIGIPVSIGIAVTKTLAKVANKIAKKQPTGLFMIDSEACRIEALRSTAIGDVWGVGRGYAKTLEKRGVRTAYDFSLLSDSWVKDTMGVVGFRLVKELRGEVCHSMQEQLVNKKGICTSRSFVKAVSVYEDISQAIASHANNCAEKLRKQKSCATVISVYIATNRHRSDQPQYSPSMMLTLSEPTNSSSVIIQQALNALRMIFKQNFKYKRAGVMITGIIPESQKQLSMFDEHDRNRQDQLSSVLDLVNAKFGKGSLKIAAMGTQEKGKTVQERLSPNYLTQWSDLLVVKAK